MKITINYKNGNTLTEKINYVHTEADILWYTVDSNPHPIFQEPVTIPLNNINSFSVDMEGEEK